MFKKFLASIAIMGVFLTPVASAFTSTTTPVLTDQAVLNLEVDTNTINPSNSESVKIAFDVVLDSEIYAYVIANTGSPSTIDTVFADRVATSAGTSVEYTWDGSSVDGVAHK